MPITSKDQKIKNSKVSDIEPLETVLARCTDTAGQHAATVPDNDKASLFLALPLEGRCQIYRYAMGAIELEIGDRRALRRESIANRYNRFAHKNFTIHHFSLLRTSSQIRKEVQAYALNKLSFRVTLGYRLDYPGEERDKIDDQILLMLQTAKKITIYVNKSSGS